MTDRERTISVSQRNPFEGKIEEFVTSILFPLYLLISYIKVARPIPCEYLVFYNNIMRKKRKKKNETQFYEFKYKISKQHVLFRKTVMSNKPKKAGWSRPSVDYVNLLEMKNYVQKINEIKFKFLIFGHFIYYVTVYGKNY